MMEAETRSMIGKITRDSWQYFFSFNRRKIPRRHKMTIPVENSSGNVRAFNRWIAFGRALPNQ
jgi:hypothetical protein